MAACFINVFTNIYHFLISELQEKKPEQAKKSKKDENGAEDDEDVEDEGDEGEDEEYELNYGKSNALLLICFLDMEIYS